MLLDECKYEVKNKKVENLNNDLELTSSDDESDNESDSE